MQNTAMIFSAYFKIQFCNITATCWLILQRHNLCIKQGCGVTFSKVFFLICPNFTFYRLELDLLT